MRRTCCGLLLAALLAPGCVWWPHTPDEDEKLPPDKAGKAVEAAPRRTKAPVTPDQITEANAMKKSQELWDELDQSARGKK